MDTTFKRIRTAVDAIVLAEGLHRTKDGFAVDLERDYRSDVLFFYKPVIKPDHFSAFRLNSQRKSDAGDVKLALKYLTSLDGDWEAMLDLAAESFNKHIGAEQFDLIITPHPAGTSAVLANNIVASLEPYLKPSTKIIRGGLLKTDGAYIDWERVEREAPSDYDEAKMAEFKRRIQSNFDGAVRAAERTGSFKIRNIMPQFRKFISGMVDLSERAGNVLLVDDVRTTGNTHRMAQEVAGPDSRVFLFTLL